MSIGVGSAMDHAHLTTVEQLIQACEDSGLGFQETAADVADEELSRLFRQWSGECFHQAERLGECMNADHGLAVGMGTWLDGWRRNWLSVRAAVNVGDRATMLVELERAEGRVYKIIEDLRAEVHDPALLEALAQHLSGTRAIIDMLRKLRTGPMRRAVREVDKWSVSRVGGGEVDCFREVASN